MSYYGLCRLCVQCIICSHGFTTDVWLPLQVTVFSTSENKREEALKVLKADHFIVSKDEEQMKVRAISSLYVLVTCRDTDIELM